MWLSSSTAIAVPRIRLRMAPHGEGKSLVFLVPVPPLPNFAFCILHFAFPNNKTTLPSQAEWFYVLEKNQSICSLTLEALPTRSRR